MLIESWPLLTEKDASKLLNVSVAALQRWRHEKRGPRFIKLNARLGSRGGLIRYKISDIEAWLAQQATGGEAR